MDSLIFELQIIFYFQLFLSANVRHNFGRTLSYIWQRIDIYLVHARAQVSNWCTEYCVNGYFLQAIKPSIQILRHLFDGCAFDLFQTFG